MLAESLAVIRGVDHHRTAPRVVSRKAPRMLRRGNPLVYGVPVVVEELLVVLGALLKRAG